MKTTGSINQHDISTICLGTLQSIKSHTGRVTAHLLFYNGHTNTFAPNTDLLYSSCTECIGSSQINLLTSLFKLISQFTYGSSLTHSIHANNKNYVRLMVARQIPIIIVVRMILRQEIGDFITQNLIELRSRNIFITCYTLFDTMNDFHGSLYTNIRSDENFLQIIKHIIIYGRLTSHRTS